MAIELVVDNGGPAKKPAPCEPPVTAQMALKEAIKALPREAVAIWKNEAGDVFVGWGGLDKGEAQELIEIGARILGYE